MGGGGDGIYESVGRCNFLGGGEGALRRMKGRGRYFLFFWKYLVLMPFVPNLSLRFILNFFFFPCSFPLFWSLSCTNFKIVEMFFFFKFQEVKHKFCTFPSHRKSMYELLDYYHEFKI